MKDDLDTVSRGGKADYGYLKTKCTLKQITSVTINVLFAF